MGKVSENFLNSLDEMEFLIKTMTTLHIYYSDLNKNLAKIIKETRFCLLNATIDFAVDLDHKMNHLIDKEQLIKRVIKNLEDAYKNIHHFPIENKSTSFDDLESELLMLLDFVREYSASDQLVFTEFDLEEKRILTNKILIIKSRRTI